MISGGFEEVAGGKEGRDKHFPLFVNDNLFRRLFDSPKKFCSYVSNGQVVADLGCGPGYYTIALAEHVGPEGRVYAVDSDEKAVRAVEKKAAKRGYSNVEAHASSASDLRFIKDGSVDFVLAEGLFCSMAPQYHEAAVNEIKRVLKPDGKAYICAFGGSWEKIHEAFRVESTGKPLMTDRWAVVSIKHG